MFYCAQRLAGLFKRAAGLIGPGFGGANPFVFGEQVLNLGQAQVCLVDLRIDVLYTVKVTGLVHIAIIVHL
jgi:hypothetical protein